MNNHLKNLNRIEFVITMACTGKCKHCSQGEHKSFENIDKLLAADAVRKIAKEYDIASVMTFGLNKILMAFTSTATAVFGVYFKLQSFFFMPLFGLN